MKVGEYIRTPYGIRKIVDIQKDDGYGKPKVKVIKLDDLLNTNHKYSYAFYTDEKVIKEAKSSPNIIDLIEVGDYVNGKKVVNKQYHYTDEDNYDMGEWCIFYENVALGDYQYDIKSIVTKESMESVTYYVK